MHNTPTLCILQLVEYQYTRTCTMHNIILCIVLKVLQYAYELVLYYYTVRARRGVRVVLGVVSMLDLRARTLASTNYQYSYTLSSIIMHNQFFSFWFLTLHDERICPPQPSSPRLDVGEYPYYTLSNSYPYQSSMHINYLYYAYSRVLSAMHRVGVIHGNYQLASTLVVCILLYAQYANPNYARSNSQYA